MPGGHTSFKEQRKGSRARQVASSKITDSKIAEDEDEGRVFLKNERLKNERGRQGPKS